MKRYSILKIFVVEGAAVEVVVLVTVKAMDVETVMKKRMSRTNRIGMVEDVIVGEAACQIIQMLSATTVASMGTTQNSANQMSSAIIAVSMDTMQMSAIPRKK
jgi:pyruvate/2-oxoglutarate/acetoin dehydrogenase E1 component